MTLIKDLTQHVPNPDYCKECKKQTGEIRLFLARSWYKLQNLRHAGRPWYLHAVYCCDHNHQWETVWGMNTTISVETANLMLRDGDALPSKSME